MHNLEEPDPLEDDLVGKVLCGKWRVLRRIGRGGMSTVYAATHRNGRMVAVKVLRRALAANRRIVTRFLREGYVANKIHHPGAVAILDDDVDPNGTVFLVMELLDGATLSERFGRAAPPPPVGEVLAVGERLLDVLVAAHASGVVHRDIKPSNVFLTREGAVMLLDFGIARLFESESENFGTNSGATLGTPGFMAPEQARGRGNLVDARTDIWAVGASLFFLLTGRTVHEAETPNELLIASATQPARSIGEFCVGLPNLLVTVVDRALEMDRDRRWPDAVSMRAALARTREASSSEVLARRTERAVGMTGASTLPETHTGEPAVVSRKLPRDGDHPRSRAAKMRGARAAAWLVGVVVVSAAGIALFGPHATPLQSTDIHRARPVPEARSAASRAMTAVIAPKTDTIGAPRTPASTRPADSAEPHRKPDRSSGTARGRPLAVRAPAPSTSAVRDSSPAPVPVDVLDLRQ